MEIISATLNGSGIVHENTTIPGGWGVLVGSCNPNSKTKNL